MCRKNISDDYFEADCIARSVEALFFSNMGGDELNARSVEALLFVNMGDDALNARSVEALLFMNMKEYAQRA